MLLDHPTILADSRSRPACGGAGFEPVSPGPARRIATRLRNSGEPVTLGEVLRRPVTERVLRVLACGAFVAGLYALIGGAVGLAVVL
jgi:hypothetical protein